MIERVERLSDHVGMAVWRMEESVDELLSRHVWLVRYRDEIGAFHNEARRKERLCEHLLIHALAGRDLQLRHGEAGEPHVDGHGISISHTRGRVVVLMSDDGSRVGVDIEYVSNRVERIASHFLRDDERGLTSSITAMLIAWCAKETLFKWACEKNLQYKEMRVVLDGIAQSGDGVVSDLRDGVSHVFHYVVAPDHVLTYMV